MSASERGIVAQIRAHRSAIASREELKRTRELEDSEYKKRRKEEEKLRQSQALTQSFLRLRPEVESLLQEIADKYTDPNGNSLVQPNVETFTPVFRDPVHQLGHFALIWGCAQPTDFGAKAIDDFTKAKELLTSSKRLSKRKISQLTKEVNDLGQIALTISGFNTVVFTAETEEDFSRKLLPVLYLQGTDIPRTRIQSWHDNTRITETTPPIAPILAGALDHPSNLSTFPFSVAEFVTVGAENIRPTGPFV